MPYSGIKGAFTLVKSSNDFSTPVIAFVLGENGINVSTVSRAVLETD